ncbi:superoxide dismutase [Pelosinus propionicus]|uniref:Superoxide dismutase n=1 Tax=Pelosinus propionicus DSM 13327 TaxID=1123291 RepID=A0A1I4JV84_9FIRM|nr:superoxide dismutase [Pelosinus propionicus]SFL70364.1 superoxide dismutase, Fe-Mn family [Pelosinus propionicus DSM 13327]
MKQVELKYGFEALEPHIDELTMRTHYSKHHATYINNFNVALEKLPELSGKTVEEVLADLPAISDAALRAAIQNNGGGFYNHNLYFTIMSPEGGGEPAGALAKRIEKEFGSFAEFKEKIKSAAVGRFGSGWAWLSTDSEGNLAISSTPNQDNPLMETGNKWIPILTIDVWEHAYYLKYKNLRPDYIEGFFQVIDWKEVARLYEASIT